MPCFGTASFNSIKLALAKIPQEERFTTCEALYSPNPWTVFPEIKDIKLITKLFCFVNWRFWRWVGTWRQLLKIPWTASKHRWSYPQSPFSLRPLQPLSGISGKLLLGLSLLILCSELFKFVCPHPSEWKIRMWKTPDCSGWDLLHHNIWVCFQLHLQGKLPSGSPHRSQELGTGSQKQ